MRLSIRARRTDPDTSHQAALDFEKDQSKANRSVLTVVKILSERGPLTDFRIREVWPLYWAGPFSYTLPCKARHWAREQGKVKHAGYGSNNGRKVRLWGIGYDTTFLMPKESCPHCHRPMQ